MEFELRELGLTTSNKVVKIVLVNIFILAATYIGYKYLPAVLNLNLQSSGKLIAIIASGPAIALFATIQIGLRQQRIFAVGADGIKFGDPISGIQSYSWDDITRFNLSHDTKILQLASDSLNIEETIPLRKFGITALQYNRVLDLSSACLKK
ncbi:hypothetical protein [Rheinheimera baltica]|uniref:hypothetical protein n=1 Tax=Rheinheimera baltica TaxID=67576 RepID=UPI00273D96F6|nr:hypothetical protein [Rheinheimera baltica]MDP5191727.1 hypothetical protein [Rheinheimera baltica]